MQVVYKSSQKNLSIGPAWAIIGAIVLMLQTQGGLWAATSIVGEPTTMTSNSDFMIALRHGEHMWQTSDGATHVLINRGTQVQAGTSLRLYSSFNSGVDWTPMLLLAQSGPTATPDGVLIGDDLHVAYPSLTGKILFSTLQYDSNLQTWSLVATETAFEPSGSIASNPAMVFDAQGAVWCAFVNTVVGDSSTNLRIVRRAPDGSGWSDNGLVFGPTDNIPKERSARPVLISNGIGMVFTAHESTFWAYRLDSWPVASSWTVEAFYNRTSPPNADPYASHFSIVADANKNLHLAVVDSSRLFYFRYRDSLQAWDQPKVLVWSGRLKGTYPQITLASGTLSVFINALSSIRVFQSTNGGDTFSYEYLLSHVNGIPGTSYTKPRMETPGVSSDPIPVFQQYEDDGIKRMLYFEVPATPSP